MLEECIESKLKKLKESVIKGEFNENEFKKVYEELKLIQGDFISLIKKAYEYSRNKSLERILIELQNEDVSLLMDRLVFEAKRLNDSLKNSFEKSAYRLLELIRMGKKSDVMYVITRIYVTNNEKIPGVLLEAFKPAYDIETFKSLMYAFIGAIIRPKEETDKGGS